MTTILGISGSLRTGSFNASLLRAAAELMPEGATLDANGIGGIPLYDGDEEAANGIRRDPATPSAPEISMSYRADRRLNTVLV